MIAGLRQLREAGGVVVAGTDAGVGPAKPHDILAHAARDLTAIGFSGTGLLATLTSGAATACGVGHRKGRLAPGWDADLLAVGGDPTTDPQALFDVRGVWLAGGRVPAEPVGVPA
jgi:imidazolonepropionase-like amidohydrolase